MPSASVELAHKIFGDLSGRKALVLGSGAMAELAMGLLVGEGVRTVMVAHRHREHAVQVAEQLGMPYVGYVAGVSVSGSRATVRKEYPGGVVAEMTVTLPAVFGIQAAEKPPRYVPIARVRQAMRTSTSEEQSAAEPESIDGAAVSRMSKPEVAERAEMLEGDVDEVASRLAEILGKLGVL